MPSGRQTFIPIFEKIAEAYRDYDGEDTLVSPVHVTHMFADWTDPVRAEYVYADAAAARFTNTALLVGLP